MKEKRAYILFDIGVSVLFLNLIYGNEAKQSVKFQKYDFKMKGWRRRAVFIAKSARYVKSLHTLR